MPTYAQFKQLSDMRIQEAILLHREGHHDGAFYIAGYAIECALKAAICRRLSVDIFDYGMEISKGFRIHNIENLIVLSGLSKVLDADQDGDLDLKKARSVVTTWDESKRYNSIGMDYTDAGEFINAVNLFLSWLQNHW